jgi:hypothetical protein
MTAHMNVHTPIAILPQSDIPGFGTSILDVEDRVNTAFNAMLLAHDFIEEFCNGIIRRGIAEEGANTASYAICHARETLREAHAAFHRYLGQEAAQREAAR